MRFRPYVYDLNEAEPGLRSLEWSTRRYEISVEIRPGSAYLHVTDVQRMRGYGLPLRWRRHARGRRDLTGTPRRINLRNR